MESKRCERCGYENPGEPSACAQCGVALVTSATAARSEAATPVWQRPQAPKPVEAPPWADSANAAPWQTPPEFGKPGRARRGEANDDDTDEEADDPAPGPGDGGDSVASGIPARPPRTRRSRLPARAVAVTTLLQLGALALLIYGVYAVFGRRDIFVRLADSPDAVSASSAQGSDATNLTLFLIAGLLAVAAAGCFGWWMVRGLRARALEAARGIGSPNEPYAGDDEPLGLGSAALLGLGWIVAAGAGLLAVLVAFGLHLSGDAGTIATGYIVLAVGVLLLAVAMIRAGALVYGIENAAGAAEVPQGA